MALTTDVTLSLGPDPSAGSSKGDLVAHYALVAPIMENLFGRIPIVWTTANPLPNQRPIYHATYFGHYSRLSSEHVQHLASIGAQEFHSWFPIVEDPQRARFARFLLERPWADTQGALLESARRGARIIGDLLNSCHSAIPVLDGVGGVSIFVPLAGGPSYSDVRTWAHGIAREAIAAHPDLFSEAPNVHDDGRVHIHVSSNAEGRWSIMPYSFRASTERIATPVSWDELKSFDMFGVTLNDFPGRLSATGDVFGITLRPSMIAMSSPPGVRPGAWYGHGIMVTNVREILSDGIARTVPEIWKVAQERHLHVATTEPELLGDIELYLNRVIARGQKPAFIRVDGHKYRINEPPDPWPLPAPPAQGTAVDTDALITRLRESANDSAHAEEFESAVCDAFAALGLLTTHIGGHAAPDGYADAPLGVRGYRVMLECKSGETLRKGPDIYEAAKYKDAYHAQYCMLIGGGSGTWQQEAISEIKTHGVALWCADDLAYALQSNLTPIELEPAFAPGVIAQEVIPDILWAREHGQRKRVGIIAGIIRAAGWTTQCAAAQSNSPADAPLITEDAAMLLVDQELAAQGARVNCTRDEVRLAFEWLTNPMVGAAAWTADKTGIVITEHPTAHGGNK